MRRVGESGDVVIDLAQQNQSGIRGDVTAGKIGFNLTAREWREGQFFRCRFG
tara:strand:- start:1485 stop:1640 length:156 start_codon:yes stop_codon:yes gene_type:complete